MTQASDSDSPRIALIAALASNRCIGVDNKLPWYLPEDLKYFKAVTTGKPVIMGRTTFDSIGRPLPNRTNIVVTRNTAWSHPGVKVAHSLEAALKIAEAQAFLDGGDEVVVMGGAQIYAQALPLADRLYLTEVAKDVAGDAFFPAYDPAEWEELQRQAHHYEPSQTDYSFVIYQRRA